MTVLLPLFMFSMIKNVQLLTDSYSSNAKLYTYIDYANRTGLDTNPLLVGNCCVCCCPLLDPDVDLGSLPLSTLPPPPGSPSSGTLFNVLRSPGSRLPQSFPCLLVRGPFTLSWSSDVKALQTHTRNTHTNTYTRRQTHMTKGLSSCRSLPMAAR